MKFAKIVLYIIVLIAVLSYVIVHIDDIRQHDFSINAGWFLLAFAFQISAYAFLFMNWIGLSSRFTLVIPTRRAALAWFMSHMAKYVPGKVATILVRMDYYPQGTKVGVAIGSICESMYLLLSSAMIVLITTTQTDDARLTGLLFPSIVLSLFIAILFHPRILTRLLSKSRTLSGSINLDKTGISPFSGKLMIGYLGASLLQSLCLAALMSSLYPITAHDWVIVILAYHAARFSGLIAVFSPAGLGVQEGILFLLLGTITPQPVAIVGAIIYRLLTITAELIMLGSVVIWNKIAAKLPA